MSLGLGSGEAVRVIRQLFTGEVVRHEGRHYTVDAARIYTLPDEPPPNMGPHYAEMIAAYGADVLPALRA